MLLSSSRLKSARLVRTACWALASAPSSAKVAAVAMRPFHEPATRAFRTVSTMVLPIGACQGEFRGRIYPTDGAGENRARNAYRYLIRSSEIRRSEVEPRALPVAL